MEEVKGAIEALVKKIEALGQHQTAQLTTVLTSAQDMSQKVDAIHAEMGKVADPLKAVETAVNPADISADVLNAAQAVMGPQ